MKTSALDKAYAPHISLLLVQILFGTGPVVGKFALQTFPAMGVVAFRVSGAALLLYLLQRLGGNLKLENKREYLHYFFYAILGVLLNQGLYVTGLSLTTATNTALLSVTIPVFAMLISVVFQIERFTIFKFAGILLAAGGVIYLIDPARANFSSQTTQGDLLIVLNSLFYAWYVAATKEAFARNGALKSITLIMIFGTVLTIPFGVYSMAGMDLTAVPWQPWLAILFIIIFPTAGAYFLNAWALARVAPSVVVVYVYLQPVIGALLAIWFLGEEWRPRIFVAMLLIFTGVFLVTKRSSPTDSRHITKDH